MEHNNEYYSRLEVVKRINQHSYDKRNSAIARDKFLYEITPH